MDKTVDARMLSNIDIPLHTQMDSIDSEMDKYETANKGFGEAV